MSKRLSKDEAVAIISPKGSSPAVESVREYSSIPLAIGERTFKLCLDWEPLVAAEAKFSAQGYRANLLLAFLRLNYGSTLSLFACALGQFHPEVTFPEAMELLTPAHAPAAAAIFADAIASHMEPVTPTDDSPSDAAA